MHDQPHTAFTLTSRNPAAGTPLLAGVHARGRLDAVLFELTLRQTYCNTGDSVLEVIYTFPLPATAVLLGFAAELNGDRRDGVIVARRQAEQRYEQSLADGDAPVMLEALGNGLHTANIGNLKPGDEIVLECRYAQCLAWEQGRLRMSLPTTIAPRYGQPSQAGLQPQQAPLTSLEAEYPLDLAMVIGPALSGATVACPTHACTTRAHADGSIELELDPAARLDRDVVVLVTSREPHPSLRIRAHDACDPAAPVVVMAALTPAPSTPREAVAVKALVDCSGSMQGDSIASAGAALRGLAAALTARDRLSLSRFGSSVEHVMAPAPAGPALLHRLQPLVDGLRADLGGTETAQALAAVFELAAGTPADGAHAADVLLITDGEIWQTDASIAAARASGHRVFVIGVGSAPAESFLRTLAESTGGACEFATPGEALEAAARRMLERMRQPRRDSLHIDWGAEPSWSTPVAGGVFDGDTVVAIAGFASAPADGAVRLLARDASGGTVELARSEAEAPCTGDRLARIAAARRLPALAAADEQALAVRYQLLSLHTACIVVHERAAADKAVEPAQLHRVQSMLAAGWGGMGATQVFDDMFGRGGGIFAMCVPSAIPRSAYSAQPRVMMDVEALAVSWDPEPASLREIAGAVFCGLDSGESIEALPMLARGMLLHDRVANVLEALVALGFTAGQAWVLLARWANARSGGLHDARMSALLDPLVQGLDATKVAFADPLLEAGLGHYPNDRWTPSREQRLLDALGRATG